jgi:hypothetical protein
MSGSPLVIASSLALDDAGNSFIVGASTDPMTIGPNMLTPGLFLASLDTSGALRWASGYLGGWPTCIGCSRLNPSSITADDRGNITLASYTTERTSFGGSMFDGGVVGQFDNDGVLRWTHGWALQPDGTTHQQIIPFAIAHDARANIYVAGTAGVLPFDLGCGPSFVPGYSNGAFVVQLSPDGTCMWSTSFGGNVTPLAISVAPNGHVFATGQAMGRADFGGGLIGFSNSAEGMFVTEFDAAGAWVATATPSANPAGAHAASVPAMSLAIDASGDLYVAGTGTLDLGVPTPGGPFFAKLQSNATGLWQKVGSNSVTATLAFSLTGNPVWGFVGGNAQDFGMGPVGGGGLFVPRFDPSGTVVEQGYYHGDPYTALIAVDGKDNTIVGGTYFSSMTFGATTLPGTGGQTEYATVYVANVGP